MRHPTRERLVVLRTDVLNLFPLILWRLNNDGTCGNFEHDGVITLYLKPDTEPTDVLKELQRKLFECFPFCDDLSTRSEDGFTPHLTVGQFVGKVLVERQKTQFTKDFKMIEFMVTHVHFIARRSSDPFEIKFSIPLGVEFQETEEQFSSLTISTPSQNEPLPMAEYSDEHSDEHFQYNDKQVPEVAKRIDRWIHEQHLRKKLPKTRDKLRLATKNLCIVSFVALTPEQAFSVLLAEKYFSVDNKKQIKYPKHERFEPPKDYLSSEEYALQRCRFGISEIQNPPKTESALLTCIGQFVRLKKTVNQDEVLDYLEKKRKVEICKFR